MYAYKIKMFAVMASLTALALGGNASDARQGTGGSMPPKPSASQTHMAAKTTSPKFARSEEQWRKLLTPEQFAVMRRKGTEAPFSGKYDHFKGKGVYECPGCNNVLFSSNTKFDSGTGWPSFWRPFGPESIRTVADRSSLPERTEVQCKRCGSHLGHVFDDGPKPTGLRYCMNSVALKFVEMPAKAK